MDVIAQIEMEQLDTPVCSSSQQCFQLSSPFINLQILNCLHFSPDLLMPHTICIRNGIECRSSAIKSGDYIVVTRLHKYPSINK